MRYWWDRRLGRVVYGDERTGTIVRLKIPEAGNDR